MLVLSYDLSERLTTFKFTKIRRIYYTFTYLNVKYPCLILPHTSCPTPHTAHRTPHTAYRIPHTSCRTPHTPHRIPHTSHLTPHTARRIPHTTHQNINPMRQHKLFLFLIVSVFILSACVTHRKLTYLQYRGAFDREKVTESVTPSVYRIQPYDNLFIRVITPDPQWSAMFNTMPVSTYGGISVNEQSADLASYTVDGEGTIQLPYAGRILVAGKTLSMISADVEKALGGYVTDAAITVKMINNYVSLLGEVQQPGRYPIYKDRLNIFQALAMAGDLGEYSNRQKIQVLRQTPSGNIIKEFTLRDRSILASEFFYVMPNDVIYAEPMRGKFFQMNAFPYSVLLSSITTFLLFLNYFR